MVHTYVARYLDFRLQVLFKKLVYKFCSTNYDTDTNYFNKYIVVYYTFIKMAEVIIDNKLLMRNIFKEIVKSLFQELEEKIYLKKLMMI